MLENGFARQDPAKLAVLAKALEAATVKF